MTDHAKVRLTTGDVLIVQTGDIGPVVVAPRDHDGAGCHALIVARPRPDTMSGEFLSLVLNSDCGYNALKRIQTGASHLHLDCTYVREVPVPVPPLIEQQAVVEEAEHRMTALDGLVARNREVIDRLQEYRTALISAAVTGKIDVREARA
ncbi:MAG: hypothetical protein HN742_30965 [Lentisphaerae bacterium]|nr:hypothetical protein [Lentisphaerota bacterium]MBT4819972.1 hypothetical protein [Lentisphaerota bacterium]MBT5607938.1 hypothetical protein [Lentisphaerota bacterium]MBT7056542.1 hypothetical protein [Lentisphaerota bacterium]MBT7846333.1 hypothetical protein [Lentisphaerota bacterium]